MSLKELLRGKLTRKEIRYVPSSFDIIGSKDKAVAIIEVPLELQRKKKILAEGIMQQHRNVKTVLEKGTPRKGEFRIRKMKIIHGGRNTEVVQTENGSRLVIDPRKVYFSQRESTERQRILQLVRPDETVMVFFAGAGPFAVQIAKRVKNVIGIEKNPYGVKYFRKNIALNKLQNTAAVLGDVKAKAKKYYGKCDRVFMPLPETSIGYMGYALSCLKGSGAIHMYFFCHEDELEKKKEEIIGKVNAHCTLNVHKVLPYGPKIWKYRADMHVSKKYYPIFASTHA